MRLLEWMRRESLTDEQVAALVNEGLPTERQIRGRAVRKWKYGESEPPRDKIIRLEEITNGEVTVRDHGRPSETTASA